MDNETKMALGDLVNGVSNIFNMLILALEEKGVVDRKSLASQLTALVQGASDEAMGSLPRKRVDLFLAEILASQLSLDAAGQQRIARSKPALN